MATKFLQRQDKHIAYSDQGTGPLVLGVPSMGDVRGEYRFLAPILAQAGYRVVTMDVRGHGESSVGWDDYSVKGIGDDIVALVRSLNAGPAVLIGDSMAAGAAVVAAADAPECVAGLVLMGPFVRGGGDFMGNLLGNVLVAGPWGAGFWLSYYKTLYPSRKPDDFESYAAALRKNLQEPGRLHALQAMLKASKAASAERLTRVTAPVLVLMGTRDPDFKPPETEAKWVAEQLHAPYKMIEGAGHYPHAEMPQVTAPLILDFLKEHAHGA